MASAIQESKASFYIKRIIGLILLLSMAAVFFFSGITKLINIEPFEWTFIDIGIGNMTAAAIIARVFIGLELLIGAFLLFHIYLKQVTYPITLGLLVLLTLYLVVLIIQQGNNGNCGCFSDVVTMTPMQGIYKNIGMIVACFILMRIYPIKPYANQEWISAVLGMAALVSTFIVAPLNIDHHPQPEHRQIALDQLYKDASNRPEIDMRSGKHIIAYMSLTCPHCRKAAYLLHILKRQNPEFPIYIILSGEAHLMQPFLNETKARNVPQLLYKDMDAFMDMAGEGVPAIYWVKNGRVEYKSNYFQLDPKDIKDWLSK